MLLIRAAERLFATEGVDGARTQEIVRLAGQRNDSALSYHFGSRQGLLTTILGRHQSQIDTARGALLAEVERDARTPAARELAVALLAPLCDTLSTPDGRDYLRIAAQLTAHARFGTHLLDAANSVPPHLRRTLRLLVEIVPAEPPLRVHRVASAARFASVTLGERARQIDAGDDLRVADETFRRDLIDTVTAVLMAPPGPVASAR
jgi:AcrR family transcriptional regulator